MSSMTLPLKNYVPKEDIQQKEFLEKYPKFDGRGLLIAIIDSGVDVSLPGLHKTSTGLPKIVDCINFNESGNVNTSKIRRSGKNNILKGLSGRLLKIPSKWKNPTRQWHLGIMSFDELCPNEIYKNLNENLKQAYAEKIFKPNNIEIIEDKNILELMPENLAVDCIVWFDGQKWLASIIPFYCNDLENIKVLTNFRDSHEYSFILDYITFCITIKGEGNLLEIFFSLNGHGTAMACAAAAHFSDEPEQDGMAPGAQIVSMTIESHPWMETHKLKKAFLKCIEMGVDIVNLSFSCPSFNNWEIIELIEKMVEKHGIIITHSAGNSGPLFSTIQDFSNWKNLFYIGAVNTSEIRKKFCDEKSDKDTSLTIPTFSSRGPLLSGARGVTITAPSAAKICHPKWSSMEHSLTAGTSISSAIVAGSVACLLSALKENSIQYSPGTIKLALTNTAKLPQNDVDKLGFGDGIIQINSAFEFLQRYSKIIPLQPLPHPIVICKEWSKQLIEGIFIIQTQKSPLNYYYAIKIKHSYEKNISWLLKYSIKSDQKFKLQHSKCVESNIFYINIDVTDLKPKSIIHYAEIYGFHPIHSYIGPIFHFPITIIIPEKVNQKNTRKASAKAFKPYYLYFEPPSNSKKCKFIFSSISEEEKQPITITKTLNKFVDDCYDEKNMEEIQEGQWWIQIRWKNIIAVSIISKPNIEIPYKFKLDINF